MHERMGQWGIVGILSVTCRNTTDIWGTKDKWAAAREWEWVLDVLQAQIC